MRQILIILFTVILAASVSAQQDKRLDGLETELNDLLVATKAAGFAVAIVEGNKIIYAKGFGYRDFEQKSAADANTLFAIGSCTKAFTSSILGQLRQDDKLSFDDSPLKYVPELKFYNNEMNNNITIKDMMCHRTGLPRHDFSWYLFPTASKDSLIMRLKYQEPFTGLREKWYYNNFMFLAQGVIAEHITGKSWEDNIRERFFKPLGMNRSNVSIDEMIKSTNAATGYEMQHDSILKKTEYYNISGMSPAGSINSSVNEMSNWLIAWINKGKFNDKQIIPEAYLQEAISSQMVIRGGLPEKEFPDMFIANYGYAWFISSYKGHYRVEHGGNIDGFSANTSFFPTDSIGIVVLVNQGGSSLPGLVRNAISDRMLGVEKTDWIKVFKERQAKSRKEEQEAKTKSASARIENTKPSHNLQEYTGKYSHPGNGEFTISLQQDSLFAQFKLMKLYLRHEHYDIFEPFEVTITGIDTSESGPLRFNFTTNDAGEISGVKIKVEPELDAVEFKHKPNTIDVDSATLKKYTGEYDLAGTPVKVYIKNGNKLFVFLTGQPEYELLPIDKNKFAIRILDGYKVEFIEAEDKTFKELVFIQPNGTYKATRK
jgi:CubicO group peptidase (beta-lactamase class C family)